MSRRTSRQIETSESDSDKEGSTPGSKQEAQESTMTPRSSDRLKTRANRQFRLPSRDEVLGRIVPADRRGTPSKSLAELKPRKLVNDFVKVNYRYNYDPDFTDSETSLEGFLDDEDEKEEEENKTSDEESSKESSRSKTSSSSSEDQESHKDRQREQRKQKLHNLQKRRPFIRESDSESGDEEEKVHKTAMKRKRQHSTLLDDSSSSEETGENRRKKSHRVESMERKKRVQNILDKYKTKRDLRKGKV